MARHLIKGPDDAVRLWWRLVAREGSPSGVDPFLIKGAVAAVACVICRHKFHHEVPAGKSGSGFVDRCQRCGSLWPSRIEYVVRGTVQTTRNPHEFERRLIDLGDLEHAIDQLPKLESLLYGLFIATDRSHEYVAELASQLSLENPKTWVDDPGAFTPNQVRRAVKRGRRLLREALIARGLMARRVPVLMRDGQVESLDALEPLPLRVLVQANPANWFGVLQDIAVSEQLAREFHHSRVIRLELSRERGLGTVYREARASV